jgi:hypothetical protein
VTQARSSTSSRFGRRLTLRILILGVVCVASAARFPSATLAVVGSCIPGRTHDIIARWVITTGTVSGINGVKANILELDPYYSGSNHTGTNATVMLVNTAHSKWAQLGMYKSKIQNGSTTTRQAALEFYSSQFVNIFEFFGSRSVQTQTEYEILEDNSTFDFFVAGAFKSEKQDVYFTPGEYEMFTETHDLADQMPGVNSNPETFRQATYWTGLNHATAHTITSTISSTDAQYYSGQNLLGGTYYAWDRCGSFSSLQVDPGTASVVPSQSRTSAIPWSAPSAALSDDDKSFFDISSPREVTGLSDTAASAADWPLGLSGALKAAANVIDVTAASRAYQGWVSRAPGLAREPAWIVTTPGGTLPFDGPPDGPLVGAPRQTGVVLDPSTGELWRGFIH